MDRHSMQHEDRVSHKYPPEASGRENVSEAGGSPARPARPARRPFKLPGDGDAPETGGVPRQITEPLRSEDIETL